MRRFHIIEKISRFRSYKTKRATNGSAGYDLASIEEIIINPKEIKMIPTGIKSFYSLPMRCCWYSQEVL